jgi:prophage regulatory protein
MDKLLLSHADLKALGITYSRAHLWRLCRTDKFPRPIKLHAAARNCWSAAEVGRWIEQRVAGRQP